MDKFNINDYANYEEAAAALSDYFKSKEEDAKKQQKIEEARQDYAAAAAYYFSLAFPEQEMDDPDVVYDAILELEEASKKFFAQEKKMKAAMTDNKTDWLKELKKAAAELDRLNKLYKH